MIYQPRTHAVNRGACSATTWLAALLDPLTPAAVLEFPRLSLTEQVPEL